MQAHGIDFAQRLGEETWNHAGEARWNSVKLGGDALGRGFGAASLPCLQRELEMGRRAPTRGQEAGNNRRNRNRGRMGGQWRYEGGENVVQTEGQGAPDKTILYSENCSPR